MDTDTDTKWKLILNQNLTGQGGTTYRQVH